MKTETMVRIIRTAIAQRFDVLPNTVVLHTTSDAVGIWCFTLHIRLHGVTTWKRAFIRLRRYDSLWSNKAGLPLRKSMPRGQRESVMFGVGSWYEAYLDTSRDPYFFIEVVAAKRLLDRELNQEM